MLSDNHEKALKMAKDELKSRGLLYPLYDAKLSPEQNHERILAYAKEETMLYVQFLNKLGGDRPLVTNTTEPKRQWGNSYYDR